MKFLKTYENYILLKEQQTPTAPIADWFNKGFYSAAGTTGNLGSRKAFGLDEKDKVCMWGMVDKLGKVKGNQPFKNVAQLQKFLWKKLTEFGLKDDLDTFRKNQTPPREPSTEQGFVDGRYGAQTNMILGAVAAKMIAELGLNEEEKKKAQELTQKNFPAFYQGLNVPMDVVKGEVAPGSTILKGVSEICKTREFVTGADQIKATVDEDSIKWGGPQPTINDKVEERPNFNYSVMLYDVEGVSTLRVQTNDDNPNAQAIKGEIKKQLDKLNLDEENKAKEQDFSYIISLKGLQAESAVTFVEDILGTIPMYGEVKAAPNPNVAKKGIRNPFKKTTTLPSGEVAAVAKNQPNFR